MVQIKSFPIQEVRNQFPALNRTYNGKEVVYFDGPGGSQVVSSAIQAMVQYMENGGANLHGSFPSSHETEEIITNAKEAVADLLTVDPSEVAFGANMTTLALSIARALGRSWGAGDEIVVTELDHRANVDPWVTMAEDKGVTVRWIRVNPDTYELDLTDLEDVINERTRLVAVGLASNAVGTINDMSAIAERAKEVGASVAVDAVHATPHIPIERDKLGADILLCSAYKFFGPHVGVAAIRKELFEKLEPFKLTPAPSYIPDKLETGTQNHEGIAGVVGAIEFIASLGEGTTRKEKIRSGLEKIDHYETELATKIRKGLAELPNVTLYQAHDHVAKTPTISFTVDGYTPQEVCQRLCEEHSIFVADGHFYASTLAEKTGIIERGGWVRAGLAPYNTAEEVERFLLAIREL